MFDCHQHGLGLQNLTSSLTSIKSLYCFSCTKYIMEQRPNRYVNCFPKEFLLDLLMFLTNLISLDLDQRLAGTPYDTEVLLFGIL